MDNSQKKLAVTVGDPSGIGPEVILGWAKANPQLHSKVAVIAHKKFLDALPAKIGKVQAGESSYSPVAGKPDASGAAVALDALEKAAAGCLEGAFCAVTTAPISKAQMKLVGFDYPGQTEFFAARWKGIPVMAFAGKKLLLSLVTWHEPLRSVYSSIDEARLKRAVEAAATLAQKIRGIENPRIAVCGLNPHAGEGGLLGAEEKYIIDPILNSLRERRYPNLSVALPPDTVFARTLKGEFDCIVSMYHDQGLAPLKALEFDDAVNVSMNLKFIRTSPDHGTAFQIAGRGIASFNSFAAAVELALKLK